MGQNDDEGLRLLMSSRAVHWSQRSRRLGLHLYLQTCDMNVLFLSSL